MSEDLPTYEVLAVRFGSSRARPGSQNFIMPDGHDGPMQMDFYIWVIRREGRTIVVDTGFSPGASSRRNRQFVHAPAEALAQATGRCICHTWFRRQSEVDDVVALVRNLYAGRVKFHDGAGEIAPGVTVHLIGGHTGGLQVVRVHTARGWVVLASDAVHYWANIEERNPFPAADVMGALEGFATVEGLADGPAHIIPGHDPAVLTRFPPLRHNIDIVRVDLPPTHWQDAVSS